MIVLETERLRLRWLTDGDAPFILELLNDPDWLRHIGDRGVRNLDDASVKLLKRLGLRFERSLRLDDGKEPLQLFTTDD